MLRALTIRRLRRTVILLLLESQPDECFVFGRELEKAIFIRFRSFFPKRISLPSRLSFLFSVDFAFGFSRKTLQFNGWLALACDKFMISVAKLQ